MGIELKLSVGGGACDSSVPAGGREELQSNINLLVSSV